jgi:prepilin-type N-terminal cleavage/methylation domain-containing protein
VFGTYKSGFTLIELLVAIAIVTIMMSIVVPKLWQRAPEYERKQFVGQLNALARYAWQSALTTGVTHQLLFNFEQKTIMLKKQTDTQDAAGKPVFLPVKNGAFKRTITIPSHIQVKQFLIEGSDAMKAFVGRPTQEVWFFIIANGLSQEVTMNMVDTKDRTATKTPRSFGLVLNPFTVQFKVYDEFKK